MNNKNNRGIFNRLQSDLNSYFLDDLSSSQNSNRNVQIDVQANITKQSSQSSSSSEEESMTNNQNSSVITKNVTTITTNTNSQKINPESFIIGDFSLSEFDNLLNMLQESPEALGQLNL